MDAVEHASRERWMEMTDEAALRALLHETEDKCMALRAERDALRALLVGFSGPPPSPRQWVDICNKAAEIRAALREGGK